MATGKLNVYLVRHGKTMFNTSRRVQGWSDTPLTNEGIEVAEFLGRGLRETPFDAIYTVIVVEQLKRQASFYVKASRRIWKSMNYVISVSLVLVNLKVSMKILCLEK